MNLIIYDRKTNLLYDMNKFKNSIVDNSLKNDSSLISIFLLNKLYKAKYGKDLNLKKIKKNKYGKVKYPKINFSISNNDNYIVCVLNNKKIGIDIQEVKNNNTFIVNNYFNNLDKELIYNSSNKDLCYSKIWTYKEAFLKLKGYGIKKIKYLKKNVFKKKYKLISITHNNIIISVCYKK